MAYKRIGTYMGKTLPPPESYLDTLSFQAVDSGYAHVDRRQEQVRQLFYPYVCDLWPGRWDFATIVVLKPGGTLGLHSDNYEHARPGALRNHLVLQTNSDCWLFHGGEWQQLEAGGVYQMDPRLPHGGVNWGTQPRLHLVIDYLEEGPSRGR